MYIYFQTIRFNVNESSYLVFQEYYPHSLTWNDASDLCKKHGYRLWKMESYNEWITVSHALKYFMLGFNSIPIDLQCSWQQIINTVSCM